MTGSPVRAAAILLLALGAGPATDAGLPGAAADAGPPSADPAAARPGPAASAGTGSPSARAGGGLRVGPDAPYATIPAALEAAAAGDTVRVEPGTYPGPVSVDRPVTLLGEGRPVIDAGGRGHAVETTAGIEIRGFVLRNTGKVVDREHAAVMVRGARAVVADNVMEDVFYGVYLKEAPGSIVAGNRIVGKDLPPPRRGDGIRLWYSSGTEVVDNRVRGTRDVVVYFSDSLRVRGNVITDGRYGLHYMYSDHNEFRENVFRRNQVGAFVMYSRDVRLRDNVFAEARGASGMGLGLKDADGIRARGNLFVRNESGVYLDNSPRGRDARNRFRGNLFLYNESAVRLLPSVAGNDFRANSFVENTRPAVVSGGTGGGQAAQNDWTGNHWSGYAGFDRDGDGIGDTPYVHARLADDLMSRHEALELFARSPVMPVLEAVRRFFPFLEPEPVVVDSAPRLAADALVRWERSPPVREGTAREGTAGGPGPGIEALAGEPAAAEGER